LKDNQSDGNCLKSNDSEPEVVVLEGDGDFAMIENEENLRKKSKHGVRRFSNAKESESNSSQDDNVEKESLSDVWIFDTLLRIWFELKPGFKI
jgi:hypothetical protein